MSNTKILREKTDLHFLVITTRGYAWIDPLRDWSENVQLVSDPAGINTALTQSRFDIILYDDTTSDMSSLEVIEQMRLMSPRSLIAVISDDLPDQYYDAIILAGAADAVSSQFAPDVMMQRISVLVRQSEKNRQLANRTRRLHAINLLSQKLHNATHPKLMIVDAIELICSYFNMYAVAITIKRNNRYVLHAGTAEARRRIYETDSEMLPENPLRQVIDSQMSLIFPDVSQHPYYKSIPVIEAPKSSVIVPIKIGNRVTGSLAIFSDQEMNFRADVAVYELLGANVGTAYEAIAQHHAREIDVQSMRYVLKAWPELNAAFTRPEISQVIHNYVQDIETISAIGIWLFATINEIGSHVYSEFTALESALDNLRKGGHREAVVGLFDKGIQPQMFNRSQEGIDVIDPLFEVLGTSRLMIVPITGNSFEGVMVLASASRNKIPASDLSLVESLSRVTATVLERNTLIESIQDERRKLQEQTGRVEGVLRSIEEGIFFVDDSRQVVYTNPQFSELTTIAPSVVLNQPSSKLLAAVAGISPETQDVLAQLEDAASQIEGRTTGSDDLYPIVSLDNIAGETIVIEFMQVDADYEQRGWIGVLSHAMDTTATSGSTVSPRLQNMLEDMTMPIIELGNTTMTLPQQYDILSASNFEGLMNRLEDDVRSVQSMWGNFVQIFKGETEGIQIRGNVFEPSAFIEGILTNRRMSLYQRQIRFDKQVLDASIRVDERQMRQCFINLVEFLSDLSNRGAPIFVEVTADTKNVIYTLQEKTTILPDNELSNIFTPRRDSDFNDDLYPHRLGMYLARQIVKAHGGQLSVTNARGNGLTIKLALPLTSDNDPIMPLPSDTLLDEPVEIFEEEQVSNRQAARGLTMTIVESQGQFLENLYPEMEYQGHEIFIEPNIDGALYNLKVTKVDIILIELSANTGLVGQVQRLRAQSEVPIVIISLPEFEDECLSALAQGADDYFLVPLNEEKLLAQLHAISKRQEIAARTAEPIRVGDLEIDFSRRRVYLSDKLIDLTAKEYELLRVLAMNQGQVMSHKQLLAKVWGPEHDAETQYLWVNISRLRRKLEPKKDSPRYIQNEPRVGYVFTPDVK